MTNSNVLRQFFKKFFGIDAGGNSPTSVLKDIVDNNEDLGISGGGSTFDLSDRMAKGADDNGEVVEGAVIEGKIIATEDTTVPPNKASGHYSHAEGASTEASGLCAHAEGYGTQAIHRSQHVFGEYNEVESSGTPDLRGLYVEIVGNGTASNSHSNARTLDWRGNEKLAGSLTLGMGTADEVTITATQLTALLALLNA